MTDQYDELKRLREVVKEMTTKVERFKDLELEVERLKLEISHREQKRENLLLVLELAIKSARGPELPGV